MHNIHISNHISSDISIRILLLYLPDKRFEFKHENK